MNFCAGIFVIFVLIASAKGDRCETAKQWGFICTSETEYATCVQSGTTWQSISLTRCDTGYVCNYEARNCSKVASNYASNFECPSGVNFFPDLWNCGDYLACNSNFDFRAFVLQCPDGYAFSTVTNYCSERRTEEFCSRRRISCKTLGEFGALPENNNFVYYCRNIDATHNFLFPQLTKCPENQVFRENRCVTSDSASPGISVGKEIKTCTAPGVKSKDPSNCRAYYYCDSQSNLTKVYCGWNTIYDEQTRKCRFGSC